MFYALMVRSTSTSEFVLKMISMDEQKLREIMKGATNWEIRDVKLDKHVDDWPVVK